METLPLELLTEVAWNIRSTSDVQQFRLVSRAFAYAASPVLFHRVHAINSAGCLAQLHKFQKCPSKSASAARHLTIYHGEWPDFGSIDAWSSNPHALKPDSLSSLAKGEAYSAYREFICQEARRSPDEDISRLTEILALFPNLNSLTVSHIRAWRWGELKNDHYYNLSWKIRIVPFFKPWVEDLVYKLLPILCTSSRLNQLSIQGSLDLRGQAKWTAVNRNILRLQVQSLLVCESREDQVDIFLRSFPNIQELDLGTEAGGWIRDQALPLRSLWWPDLWRVIFHHLWASEDELIDFLLRHPIRRLTVHNVTLFEGSWASFFDRTQSLPDRSLESSECILPSGRHIDLAEAAAAYERWPASDADALNLRVCLTFTIIENMSG